MESSKFQKQVVNFVNFLKKVFVMHKKITILSIGLIFSTITSNIISMDHREPEPDLHKRVTQGDLDGVKRVVELNREAVTEVCSCTSRTALHHAVSLSVRPGKPSDRAKGKAIAIYLLENGAEGSVLVEDLQKKTPLGIENNSWHTDVELLDVLLEKGQPGKACISDLILYRVGSCSKDPSKNVAVVACLLKHLVIQD